MDAAIYLARQERLAREDLAAGLEGIKAEVTRVVNLPDHIRKRPILSLGAGAACGFLVGRTARGGDGRGRRLLYRWLRPVRSALRVALLHAVFADPADRA
jgi:hypothetical protein